MLLLIFIGILRKERIERRSDGKTEEFLFSKISSSFLCCLLYWILDFKTVARLIEYFCTDHDDFVHEEIVQKSCKVMDFGLICGLKVCKHVSVNKF